MREIRKSGVVQPRNFELPRERRHVRPPVQNVGCPVGAEHREVLGVEVFGGSDFHGVPVAPWQSGKESVEAAAKPRAALRRRAPLAPELEDERADVVGEAVFRRPEHERLERFDVQEVGVVLAAAVALALDFRKALARELFPDLRDDGESRRQRRGITPPLARVLRAVEREVRLDGFETPAARVQREALRGRELFRRAGGIDDAVPAGIVPGCGADFRVREIHDRIFTRMRFAQPDSRPEPQRRLDQWVLSRDSPRFSARWDLRTLLRLRAAHGQDATAGRAASPRGRHRRPAWGFSRGRRATPRISLVG